MLPRHTPRRNCCLTVASAWRTGLFVSYQVLHVRFRGARSLRRQAKRKMHRQPMIAHVIAAGLAKVEVIPENMPS